MWGPQAYGWHVQDLAPRPGTAPNQQSPRSRALQQAKQGWQQLLRLLFQQGTPQGTVPLGQTDQGLASLEIHLRQALGSRSQAASCVAGVRPLASLLTREMPPQRSRDERQLLHPATRFAVPSYSSFLLRARHSSDFLPRSREAGAWVTLCPQHQPRFSRSPNAAGTVSVMCCAQCRCRLPGTSSALENTTGLKLGEN